MQTVKLIFDSLKWDIIFCLHLYGSNFFQNACRAILMVLFTSCVQNRIVQPKGVATLLKHPTHYLLTYLHLPLLLFLLCSLFYLYRQILYHVVIISTDFSFQTFWSNLMNTLRLGERTTTVQHHSQELHIVVLSAHNKYMKFPNHYSILCSAMVVNNSFLRPGALSLLLL